MKMKLTVKHTTLLFTILILSEGCMKNYTINDNQVVLFQKEYINYAWGYQHNGYFIDNKGNILTYDQPESWNFAGGDMMISQDKLIENINKCTISGVRIENAELKRHSSYIGNIAASPVSSPVSSGADMGAISYICYILDENTGYYKGFLIKQEGDNTRENLNFFSKRIVNWMKGIESGLENR